MAHDTTQALWRTSWKHHFTKTMLLDLIKRVEALTKRYERYLPRKSTDTPEDRIHTAIAKLFAGTRNWDPTRVDLPGFLAGVVASDLSAEVERGTKAGFVSLDVESTRPEDDYTGESLDDVEVDNVYTLTKSGESLDDVEVDNVYTLTKSYAEPEWSMPADTVNPLCQGSCRMTLVA